MDFHTSTHWTGPCFMASSDSEIQFRTFPSPPSPNSHLSVGGRTVERRRLNNHRAHLCLVDRGLGNFPRRNRNDAVQSKCVPSPFAGRHCFRSRVFPFTVSGSTISNDHLHETIP